MASFCDVFERVEKKYLIDSGQRSIIESSLRPFMAPDSYGCTKITSLYLDNDREEVVNRSLEKPLYKEKIRLRAYGEEAGSALVGAFSVKPAHVCDRLVRTEEEQEALPLLETDRGLLAVSSEGCVSNAFGKSACDGAVRSYAPGTLPSDGLVFCELKKKFDGVVYKRRVGMSLAAAIDYMGGRDFAESCIAHPCADAEAQKKSLSKTSLQISREIDAALKRYAGLHPHMAIEYMRTAWAPHPECESELGGLRITFDGTLRSKMVDSPLESWNPVVDQGLSVMEIKSSGPYPVWLTEALSHCGVFPRSFTKYGIAHLLSAVSDYSASDPDAAASAESVRDAVLGCAPNGMKEHPDAGCSPITAQGVFDAPRDACIASSTHPKGAHCA